MSHKSYRIFETLRVAMLLTFISGYIDAFTFHTQGGRFAAVQTGNLIYMSLNLAQGDFSKSFNYFVPIFVFSLGQWFNYFFRRYLSKYQLRWHAFSSLIMLLVLLLVVLLAQYLPSIVVISSLTFFAAMQADTFKRLRGTPYANVMMTGNIKNAAQLLVKGLVEKNSCILQEALRIYAIILSFILGIILSSFLSQLFGSYGLFFVLFPVLLVNYWLITEKPQV